MCPTALLLRAVLALGQLVCPYTDDRSEGAFRLPWSLPTMSVPGAGSLWSVSLCLSVVAVASGWAGKATETRKLFPPAHVLD